MGFSIWFASGRFVVRMDGRDDGVHWSRPKDLAGQIPVLALMGAFAGPLGIMGGVQTGPSELVLILSDPGGWHGAARLDMATGAVVEFPARFESGLGIAGPDHERDITGMNPMTVLIRGLDAYAIFNPVDGTVDGPRTYEELGFLTPGGSTDLLTGGGKAVFVPGNDELHLFGAFGFGGTYQVFDVNARTTDGTHRPLAQDWGPLVDAGMAPPGAAWLMTGDTESWPAPKLTRDVSDGVLQAVRSAAVGAEVDPGVLLGVAYMQSGMRLSAYHPAGHYGLLQLTAEQLEAAGWGDLPGNLLDVMPEDQAAVMEAHLLNVGIPPDADEAFVWGSLLLQGEDLEPAPETVVGAADGPREDVYARHRVADMDGDGVLTLENLHRYVRSRRDEPRLRELQQRMQELF